MRVIVNMDVPDLDRAIEFYRDAVGLELSRIIDSDVAELAGASCTLYLLQKPARSPAARAVRESACIEWRDSTCITLSAPFGHGFCLIELEAATYTDDD